MIKKIILPLTLIICMLSSIYIYAEESSTLETVTVIHTNDIHGRSSYSEGSVVGFEKLASYIQNANADLVVDAGDYYHGQAFATLTKGETMARLMAQIGYDAMTPGNHDWNYGKDRLKELGTLSNTPILAGNITKDGENYFGNDGTLIKDLGDIQVGILGVYDPAIKSETAPRNVTELDFNSDVETANKLAQKLRDEGCEIVIALSHRLYCEDFIKQTKGIDILIAGHEHSVMDENYIDADGNTVKVVETGCYFANIGNLTITYDKAQDKITNIDEKIVSASDASTITSDEKTAQLLSQINDEQNTILNQVVGSTGYSADGVWESLRIRQTGMGRLVTSAYLHETGADIAFENAGGIRIGKVLNAGNITYKDIIDTAPYGNYIITKAIKGSDVKSIIERSIDIGIQNKLSYDETVATGSDQVRWSDNNGSYLQFGGIDITYDLTKSYGNRVISAKVNGIELSDTATYTIATNNYIGLGGLYTELKDVDTINQYSACDEALINYIQLGEATVNSAINSYNDTIIGSCGDNLTYTLKGHNLKITGTGEMYNYIISEACDESGNPLYTTIPWYTDITSAELKGGITSIGNYAFANCVDLDKITIPNTVTAISENAFLNSKPTISCYANSYANSYAVNNNIPYSNISILYGDADGDNEITINDVSELLNKVLNSSYKLSIEDITTSYEQYLDLDQNNGIDSADVAHLLQHILDYSYNIPVI